MEFNELKTILERLPVDFVVVDEEGFTRLLSDSFARLISRERQALEDQPLELLLDASDKINLRNCLEKPHKNKSGRTGCDHLKILNRKGQAFDLKLTDFTDLHSGNYFLIGVVDHHVTTAFREKDLAGDDQPGTQQAGQKEDEELDEMKSRFLSIASHEFRTPLTGILSSLNLIDRYLKAEQDSWLRMKNHNKVANHLEKINESVKNLTTILNKFLSLGNIEKGEIPINPIRFDLKKTLELQRSQFQQLCKKGQVIHYQHKSQESMVTLDKFLLRNIMNNLLSNAIKFSPAHSEIHLESVITADYISIRLSDQGIGIPADEQSKIFTRFYRAKNALSDQEGTGLGLNIVKEYVGLLEGDITFISEEHAGTTFLITFPIKKNQ